MPDQIKQSEIAIENAHTVKTQSEALPPKVLRVLSEEVRAIDFRLLVVQFFVSFLPHNSLNRLRTVLYRLAGVNIGKKTLILGKLTLISNRPISEMLEIGNECLINSPVYADLSAKVTIGNNVGVGHHVVLITTSHDTSSHYRRCGAGLCMPITIEDGAWIGAGASILQGVTVGAGSIVAAGAVVNKNVDQDTLVGGIPAKLIKNLEAKSE